MTTYVTSTGCHVRFFSNRLALINWFVDSIEGESNITVNVASGAEFIPQMLAAVERLHGKVPRIDQLKTEEDKCADILWYIFAVGGIKKLRITRNR